MDALVPAFVATALAEFGGAAPSSRAEPRRSLLLTLLTASVIAAVAAASGWWLSHGLTPEARTLMLGLALVCAGLFPGEAKGGGALSAARAMLAGGAPFLIFAISLRAAMPALAGVGGLAGIVAAAMAVPRAAGLPLRPIRLVARGLLILAGIVAALVGLRLI